MSTPDLTAIRAAFPGLRDDLAHFENAGGAQIPRTVLERMQRYMTETYVQIGAPYDVSKEAGAVVDAARAFMSRFMNASEAGHVIFGSSTSTLLAMLAGCWSAALEDGDEVIIATAGHESNIGPWWRLREQGVRVRSWSADPVTGVGRLEDLEAMLSSRTKIVACHHVSNLLGAVEDIPAITARAHEVGARVVVDGVALAPHRAIDVAAWGVDWYAFSAYKVFGPHMGVLFGRRDAAEALVGPNHFFIPREDIPYKFELGGPSHEACAALVGLEAYFAGLAGRDAAAPLDRKGIEQAFETIVACELPLQRRLVGWLRDRPDVRFVGPATDGLERVSTISFVHTTRSSRSIAEAVCRQGIAIRFGHMYAYRLCEALKRPLDDGVVRISLVHYNTLEEVERLIAVLERVLQSPA